MRIRKLDDKHHFTLVCKDFAQLGQFVKINNTVFRNIKAVTPGSYTFILPATKEVPRRLMHPKKKTIGVRIPDNAVVQALLEELGEPLLSSTLLLPGEEEPHDPGLGNQGSASTTWWTASSTPGECGIEPTTVIDYSSGEAVVARVGMGDPSRFE